MAVMAAMAEYKVNFGLEISWLKYTFKKGYVGIEGRVERGQVKDRQTDIDICVCAHTQTKTRSNVMLCCVW